MHDGMTDFMSQARALAIRGRRPIQGHAGGQIGGHHRYTVDRGAEIAPHNYDARALDVTASPTNIDLYAAAILPAQSRKLLNERVDRGTKYWRFGPSHQHSYSPHPLRLLRARCERPGRGSATNKRDELAPPHSITSSARAIRFGGKVRPIAPAVLRLTDKVNLSGACTGSSPGRTPRKV